MMKYSHNKITRRGVTSLDINILLVDDEAIDLEWLRRRVAGNEHLKLA